MTTIRSHKLRIERDKDGSKIGKCHMHGIRKRNIWMCIGALSDDFVYERVCDEVFERWTGWHDCACLYPCVRVYMYVCVWCVHVPKYACIVCERQFLSMLNVGNKWKAKHLCGTHDSECIYRFFCCCCYCVVKQGTFLHSMHDKMLKSNH